MQRIVIIGGGFAGVWAALGAAAARRDARNRAIRITLVTREPFLTIRPRLYEADLTNVRVPLVPLLDALDVDTIVGEATRLDTTARTVAIDTASGPTTIGYDRLIVAAGSRLRRPSIPGADHAFGVDTYGEAEALGQHLRTLGSRPAVEGRFTAVVVGAGLAGLEVATTMVSRLRALSSRAASTRLAGERPEVVLVERSDAVAPDLGSNPRPVVEAALRDLGISLRLGQTVTEVSPEGVTMSSGEHIVAATTIWTGGLAASDLTLQLPAERDGLGRVVVDAYLRVPGAHGVLVAGDAARAMADAEHVAPMSCQFAIPMGERAGRNAVAELTGREPKPFRPPTYVTCIDLGEWGGLFTEGWNRQVRLTGYWGKVMKETINTRLIYPALDPRDAVPMRRRVGTLSAA